MEQCAHGIGEEVDSRAGLAGDLEDAQAKVDGLEEKSSIGIRQDLQWSRQ